MSSLDIEMFSEALARPVSFKMIIPQNTDSSTKPMKTLFLLHGYRCNAGNWIPEELLYKYNIAVVMPNGENSFYLDGLSTGRKYCTFIGDELVSYIRKTLKLAQNADETYIAGYSMGGFGALHTAFAYPMSFGKAAAMSSALIVHDIAGMKEGEDNGVANYYYYHECFGDLDKVESSMNNPEVQAKALKERGEKLPEIFMCCGTEDFLLNNNRQLHSFFISEGIPHVYRESGGGHDMTFWNKYTPEVLKWLFD